MLARACLAGAAFASMLIVAWQGLGKSRVLYFRVEGFRVLYCRVEGFRVRRDFCGLADRSCCFLIPYSLSDRPKTPSTLGNTTLKSKPYTLNHRP